MKKLCLLLFFLCLSGNVLAQTSGFADLAEKLFPSVVSISAIQDGKEQNVGSGFVVDQEGHIVTNFHVIEKSTEIKVTLPNNAETFATLIGIDKKTDLALLKIAASKPLQPIIFGDSDKMRVGDVVLAIGNPFGLGGSLSTGIISAKERDIDSGSYDNFLQTDAAINQGNSGGPLFNIYGELIGINTAIFSNSGLSQGIGFAIPSNQAQRTIADLQKFGEVKRGYIGVKLQNARNQAVISSVVAGSPADIAKLQAGDIVTKFDGKNILSAKQLSEQISESAIDGIVPMQILHNGQNEIKKIKIAELKEETAEIKTPKPFIYIAKIGADIQTANGQVIIAEIETGGFAQSQSLEIGDVIIKLNDTKIYKPENLEQILQNENIKTMQILRGKNYHFINLQENNHAR